MLLADLVARLGLTGPFAVRFPRELFEEFHKLDIGRHPFQRRERDLRYPAQFTLTVVALRLPLIFGNLAKEAVHRKMEVGVVVLEGVKILQVSDAHLQLLEQLPPARFLRRLAVLNFAAGELPHACHAAISALNGQNFATLALDNARRHANVLHARHLALRCFQSLLPFSTSNLTRMQPFCKPNRWLCTGVAASIGVEEKDQRASVREQMGKDAYDEGHDDEDGRRDCSG